MKNAILILIIFLIPFISFSQDTAKVEKKPKLSKEEKLRIKEEKLKAKSEKIKAKQTALEEKKQKNNDKSTETAKPVTADAPKPGITFSGYVKNDVYYDTRQVIALREGFLLLYPTDASYDANKKDINNTPNLNMLAIQTRLTGKITGPDAFGAKTSGVIEAEFLGTTEADINGFRLRHAYAKLTWKKAELLAGQTWNGFFNIDCFPGSISFNTGVPIKPFSRNPQIRLTRYFGKFSVAGLALSQRDFSSSGPLGSSSNYLRNSVLPILQLNAQYKSEKFLIGVHGEYKSLTPRLITDSAIYTNKKINSVAFSGYIKVKTKPITIKAEGCWGQNMTDLLMLGGYAKKNWNNGDLTVSADELADSTNIATKNDFEYTNLSTVAGWIDINTNGTKYIFGLFGGYTQNLGSLSNILDWNNSSSYYSRGNNIKYIYRVAPRFEYVSGKTTLAFETEYTVAAYGKVSELNSIGVVQNAKEIGNFRLLGSIIYKF